MIRNTFSEKVKQEITQINYDSEVLNSIFYAFILNNGSLNIKNNNKTFDIYISQNFIARYIKKLMKELFNNLNNKVFYNESRFSYGYLIKINDLELLEKKFNIFINLNELKLNEKAKKGFLIGAFLSSGSIYFATKKSSYHFEIRSSNLNYLHLINTILQDYGINSSIIKYRHAYKLYFKKSEYLSDILKIMDTEESMFIFEDIRIQKDFSNSLQRLTNLEVSNINKTIIAAQQHIEVIKNLKKENLLDTFDKKTIIFCETRLENPDASLSIISKIIQKKHKINIPRTSLNHIIKRLNKKYLEIIEKK